MQWMETHLYTQHIATVHIRFVCHKSSFVFTECALVSMVMPLRCYAYAKNNSNSNTVCNTDVVLRHDNMLLSRLSCIIIFCLVRQRQKRRKVECAALFCAAVSATFKTQRVTYTSSIMFFSRLTCTSQRHKLVSAKMFSMFSAKMSDVFTFYVA